jgi:hypothetical protein
MGRAPSRSDTFAQDRGWDPFQNRRYARPFMFGGSNFYPRRPYGAPY